MASRSCSYRTCCDYHSRCPFRWAKVHSGGSKIHSVFGDLRYSDENPWSSSSTARWWSRRAKNMVRCIVCLGNSTLQFSRNDWSFPFPVRYQSEFSRDHYCENYTYSFQSWKTNHLSNRTSRARASFDLSARSGHSRITSSDHLVHHGLYEIDPWSLAFALRLLHCLCPIQSDLRHLHPHLRYVQETICSNPKGKPSNPSENLGALKNRGTCSETERFILRKEMYVPDTFKFNIDHRRRCFVDDRSDPKPWGIVRRRAFEPINIEVLEYPSESKYVEQSCAERPIKQSIDLIDKPAENQHVLSLLIDLTRLVVDLGVADCTSRHERRCRRHRHSSPRRGTVRWARLFERRVRIRNSISIVIIKCHGVVKPRRTRRNFLPMNCRTSIRIACRSVYSVKNDRYWSSAFGNKPQCLPR